MKRFRHFWRRTVRRWWYDYEWPVIGAAAIAVLVLGCIGYREHSLAEKRPVYLLDLIFRSCQLFFLSCFTDSPMPWQLNPELLPWTDLSEALREENRLTARELPAILTRAGFQIRRTTPYGVCSRMR